MLAPTYTPRFVTSEQLLELFDLWHIARTALSGKGCTRYTRLLWASAEFHKAHPEVSATAAYKDLDSALGA